MKIKKKIFLLLILCLSSCGYEFTPSSYSGESVSVSVPYIQGDPDAFLNDELVRALSKSGKFSYVQSGGDLFIQVVILSDVNDRIGYRYDRDDKAGKKKPNVVSVENRRNLTAQVSVYNSKTGDIVFGPLPFKSSVDYDYVDYGSPKDLNTQTSYGSIPTIRYSYGQLDTVEGAHDDASRDIYKKLSLKIVECMVNQLFINITAASS